jgi:[FeFe] hydrogenase H-cluster maturation GTPase HydF
MSTTAPRGLRLHIGLFGRRNAGKSALLNALVGQEVSLVSAVPGTTTDPVEKPFELRGVGPVMLIDTAGLDDDGVLGALRVERSRQLLERVDVALVLVPCGLLEAPEERLLAELRAAGAEVILVASKADLAPPAPAVTARARALDAPLVATSAVDGTGIDELRAEIVRRAPSDQLATPLLADLVRPGEVVVLVTPIDTGAPRGRMILPQVQAIRDVLDADAIALVVKETELRASLGRLTARPALVVTDSQAVIRVAADTPPEVPLTTFSILLARRQGDLLAQVTGCLALERLRPGDRVLIAEACSHHPGGEDIGRVKIPRWLRQYLGFSPSCDVTAGRDFPTDLRDYALVVHCGGCMLGRREIGARLARCRAAGVPVTNYGLFIAYAQGLFARALSPFPAALAAWRRAQAAAGGAAPPARDALKEALP